MTGRARIAEAGTVSHSASRTLLAGAILLLLTAAGALAAPVRIVTAGELSAEISATGRTPVVLDARPSRDFRAGHVPGSLRVDWRDFSESRPGIASYLFGDPARWGLLAVDRASLLDRLRALGMSSSRPVVVVGDPSGWGEEGRVAWMLLYLGHPEVALLDGGFPAWAVENPGRIERDAAHAPSGDFEPEPQPDRRMRLERLRAAIAVGSVTLLDARTAEEFAGKRLRGQKRGGRIPGARLVPEASLRAADGLYVDGQTLAKLVGPLRPGVPLATYCTGGVRSALLAVLLEARLGIVAANYDGSLWEWGSRDDLPLETGP
ncbi:MAG: sulfurtransferase [Holophagales bacterium]|nr:sulfurtransferase [Holophagales bacterium]